MARKNLISRAQREIHLQHKTVSRQERETCLSGTFWMLSKGPYWVLRTMANHILVPALGMFSNLVFPMHTDRWALRQYRYIYVFTTELVTILVN